MVKDREKEKKPKFDPKVSNHPDADDPKGIGVAEFLSRNPELESVHEEMMSCPQEENMRLHHRIFRRFNV